ncbi:unnamed protein product [Notodromas monacha]|uniref:Ubiquitin-related modifier 1 homolog n=1 Tax=Notodromas monacha TaxID=399045 RepID=A0A7R9BIE6_9CRUS|nr:unnamed protein product [Notodromas monacha]CAG0915287.1 unnamed protein product [Notodromas monacha]
MHLELSLKNLRISVLGSVAIMTETEILSLPTDTVSRVAFAPNSKLLGISSWDKTVRVVDVASNTVKAKYFHSEPVLDCIFESNSKMYSGGLDKTLKGFDVHTTNEQVLGTHADAIKCIDYAEELGMIVTGSWDTFVKVWDPRQRTPPISVPQTEKVYALSVSKHNLVVAAANRKVMIWDLRNTQYPQQKRESNLKYQTRSVKCSPDGQGFVLSSIEGRVSVEYLDHSLEAQRKKYAFKCHRLKEGAIENIYPINAIDFHRIYGTFATGGSDGFVNIWDGVNKKRLNQFPRYPTGVTSLAFSPDDTNAVHPCEMLVDLTLQFMGGAELLLDGVKETKVNISSESDLTVKELIHWVKDNLLKSRPELFVQDGSVRPGILVLVNDVDWELLGGLGAVLKSGDTVGGISSSIPNGSKGFLCTCSGFEKEAVRELYGHLKTLCEVEENYDDIEAELEALREGEGKKFKQCKVSAKGVIFVRLKDKVKSPDIILLELMSEFDARKPDDKRSALSKIVPVMSTSKAHEVSLVKGINDLIAEVFPKLQEDSKTYSVEVNKRNNFEEIKVVGKVMQFVREKFPSFRTEPKNPSVMITVEIVAAQAFISIVENFVRFRKFRLIDVDNKK